MIGLRLLPRFAGDWFWTLLRVDWKRSRAELPYRHVSWVRFGDGVAPTYGPAYRWNSGREQLDIDQATARRAIPELLAAALGVYVGIIDVVRPDRSRRQAADGSDRWIDTCPPFLAGWDACAAFQPTDEREVDGECSVRRVDAMDVQRRNRCSAERRPRRYGVIQPVSGA